MNRLTAASCRCCSFRFLLNVLVLSKRVLGEGRQSKAACQTAGRQQSLEPGTASPAELRNEVCLLLGVNLTLIESDYLHFVIVMY